MKKLSKEKQQQLVLAVLVTCLALGGLWFGLINTQKENVRKLSARAESAQQRLEQFKRVIERADQIAAELCESRKQLVNLEEDMASGDLYSWVINTIRTFKLNYAVEIPQYSQIDGPKNVTLLADFPYKQAGLAISGTAKFYDLGRFISDFENEFPHARLVNLVVEPASGATAGDRENLSFRMEICVLVKPNPS